MARRSRHPLVEIVDVPVHARLTSLEHAQIRAMDDENIDQGTTG
jgi:hypothetical protein